MRDHVAFERAEVLEVMIARFGSGWGTGAYNSYENLKESSVVVS